MWPSIDLFEVTGMRAAASPNTAIRPIASMRSFSGVEVPWALTVTTASGPIPASSRLARIAAMIGAPSGLERVRWKPSPFSPQPST